MKVGITLEPFDGVRQQPAKPAGKLQFRLRHVANARFEVFAVRVHRSDHYFISKNELEVDADGGHFNLFIASRNACQNQHSVLSQRLHVSNTMGEEPVASRIRSKGPCCLLAVATGVSLVAMYQPPFLPGVY